MGMYHKEVVALLLGSLGLNGEVAATQGREARGSSTTSALVRKYEPLLVKVKGRPWGRKQVVSRSHYFKAISKNDGNLHGRSRIWGDVDLEVQAKVIDAIIKACKQAGFDDHQTAFVLATCRYESGFNPDAAAGSTSSSGLFQMVNATRTGYRRMAGVSSQGPFEMQADLRCIGVLFRACFDFARKRNPAAKGDEFFALAYGYHHDGSRLNAGGVGMARVKVLPWMKVAAGCLR